MWCVLVLLSSSEPEGWIPLVCVLPHPNQVCPVDVPELLSCREAAHLPALLPADILQGCFQALQQQRHTHTHTGHVTQLNTAHTEAATVTDSTYMPMFCVTCDVCPYAVACESSVTSATAW